jgi:hypothetical protein
MKKFKLLLLDTNIVIKAFELGLWQNLTERCDIYLAATVIQESEYYEDQDGHTHRIDLSQDIGVRIMKFELRPSELSQFRALFDPSYLEKLDDGETESLAFLVNSSEPLLICSADKIVYRILGNLRRSEQGISLEEVLQQIGLGIPLPRQYRKEFRLACSTEGFQDGLGGIGYRGETKG